MIVGCYASQKKELEPQIECADLRGALLQRARFVAAHFRRAEGLTQAQLDGAFGDEATLLPDGLRRSNCAEAANTAADQPRPARRPSRSCPRCARYPRTTSRGTAARI